MGSGQLAEATPVPGVEKTVISRPDPAYDWGMAHRAADLRATAQLATAATAGVTDIVEGVHLSVLQTIGLARGRGVGTTRGVTGLVYRGVRGITRLVASAIDGALAAVEANVTADATRGDGPS